MLGVREAEMNFHAGKARLQARTQRGNGAAALFMTHGKIFPRELSVPTRAQRFRAGFFGGKARGIRSGAIAPRFTQRDFFRGENFFEKAFLPTREHGFHARDFDEVDAETGDHKNLCLIV